MPFSRVPKVKAGSGSRSLCSWGQPVDKQSPDCGVVSLAKAGKGAKRTRNARRVKKKTGRRWFIISTHQEMRWLQDRCWGETEPNYWRGNRSVSASVLFVIKSILSYYNKGWLVHEA